MSDRKRWFKVWCSILNDPGIYGMELSGLGRWVLLGALTAEHGDNGKLVVTRRQLCNVLRCENDALFETLLTLPNVCFEDAENDNGTITVIMQRWHKYQVDSTGYERLKRHRKAANDNGVRREEKRREKEEKRTTPIVPKGTLAFDRFWCVWPEGYKVGKGAALKAWKNKKINGRADEIIAAVEKQKKSDRWRRGFIPNPATWINQERWNDELTEQAHDDPMQRFIRGEA